MSSFDRCPALAAIAVATIVGAGAAFAHSERDGLRCEIRQGTVFGMTALEAVVHASGSTGGNYTFTVSGPGTDIRQGGAFSVAAASPATLGKVTVSGGAYRAQLSVTADGRTLECAGSYGAL